MTTHCTMDQLLALHGTESVTEPGHAEAKAHLSGCEQCQQEAARLDQRIARLKALPVLIPGHDRYAELEARLVRERRVRTRVRWAGVGGLATAAAILGLVVGNMANPSSAEGTQQLAQVMNESRVLEGELARLDTETRAMDLVTAQVAGQLQTRIAALDEQLQSAELSRGPRPTDDQLIELWRERVGLMDALMDVHLTSASQVGL